MDNRLLERRISCPFCGERIDILVDVSAGAQSYTEDCQVCCRPIQISFEVAEGIASRLEVQRDG